MLLCYLDASAWAERYTREPGCGVAEILQGPSEPTHRMSS